MRKKYQIIVKDEEPFEKIRKKLNKINIQNYFVYKQGQAIFNIEIDDDKNKEKVFSILNDFGIDIKETSYTLLKVKGFFDNIGNFKNSLERWQLFCEELDKNNIKYSYAPWDLESNKASVFYVEITENNRLNVVNILDKYYMTYEKELI